MKIIYFFNSSLPSENASSLQVIKTCEGLILNNNEVTLITPNTGLNDSVKKFYDLKKIPKIIKINFFKKFPLGTSYYLFSFVSLFFCLIKSYDLHITRNYFTFFLLILLRKNTIIEIHNDLTIEGRVVRFLFKNFDVLNNDKALKVVVITKNLKKYLIKELNVKNTKISIISSASNFKFKFDIFKRKKKFNIGYFGSLEKGKGADFTASISQLDLKNDYFIYGGSKNQIDNLKKKFFNKNLKFSKYLPHNKLHAQLSKIDILLMPLSKTMIRVSGGVGNIVKYTSPLKLFDYLATGKLIISSELKTLNEILKKNKNCIMINDLNRFKWFSVIKSINNNIDKINYIKKNAYILSKKFTYENRAKKLLRDLNIKN